MANEKRLIDANNALAKMRRTNRYFTIKFDIEEAPTVDAYTAEQVADILRKVDELEARNRELEKEVSWQKSCLNCKIRKECPRHCGKVVHDCDHWEYGDSTVDAVEVVHGRWIERPGVKGQVYCSECATIEKSTDSNYKSRRCPNCGAKMDGDGNEV